MEQVKTLADGGEHPIIEPGVLIEWGEHRRGVPNESVSEIKKVWIDEDGEVQLVVTDTHENTPEGNHGISLGDLHTRMKLQDYQVLDES